MSAKTAFENLVKRGKHSMYCLPKFIRSEYYNGAIKGFKYESCTGGPGCKVPKHLRKEIFN